MATNNTVFKRKLYGKMLQWKQESNGETALLIEGARRIGKSTLVEEFAKKEYDSYILIDFSQNSEEVNNLFKDLSDLNYIFVRLQVIYGVTLHERKSVIIFDEVQQQPLARQAIKHLVKDHRYDYIETGSLISIPLSQAKKSECLCIQWTSRNLDGHWEIQPPSPFFARYSSLANHWVKLHIAR